MCGAELKPRKPRAGPSRVCPFCGAQNEMDAVFCESCNKLIGGTAKKADKEELKTRKKEKYYDRTYADYPSSALRTARASMGGILIMMVGVFVMIDVVFTLGIGWEITHMRDYDELARQYPTLKSAIANLTVCQGLRVVFACLALMSGFFAVQRIQYGLAIVGGILAILAVMTSFMALTNGIWLMLVGVFFLMAIIGLVMVAVSRREFMLA